MRFRVFILALACAFAAAYTAEGFIFRDYNEDEFQVATAYLKDHDPSLYSRDFIWGKPEMIRNLHVCVRGLMRVTEIVTFGCMREPIDLYILWLPVCMVAFFIGIYLLCVRFTGDRVASTLVACVFMLIHRTPWDWWGLGPMITMSARGLALALMPLMLWAYFECRGNLLRLGLCFFAWGLVSNLHPLGGWGLLEFLGIAILILERFHPRAIARVAVMGIATMIGSIPFILVWTDVVVVPPELRADPVIIQAFWSDFMGLSAPPRNYVKGFLMDLTPPLLLGVAGWFWWRRYGRPGDPGETRLLAWFPAVVVVMTFVVLVAGNRLRAAGVSLPVMVPEHTRNFKMIYLTLPVWMAFGFVGWRRARDGCPWWKRTLPLVIVTLLMMAINFPGHKLARNLAWRAGWLSAKSAEKERRDMQNDADDRGIAEWARANTSPDALFYFDSYEFRYYARRSLVFCWFDKPCVGFRPTRELEEWIKRRERATPLKKARDGRGMMQAARDYGADYLVVENTWTQPSGKPVWQNGKYTVYRTVGD